MTTRIAAENAEPGTRDWILSNPALGREIEGFCSPSSVAPGGLVQVHVSTSASQFRAEIYRLGFYSGAGGRQTDSFGPFAGVYHSDPDRDARHAGSCDWPAAFAIEMPDTAVSGCYLVKLIAVAGGVDGPERYASFVVRDDENDVDFTVHRADSTDAAYNAHIYPNLYTTGGDRATASSYDRPGGAGWGAGLVLAFDLPNLYWLEAQNVDLGYVASADLHSDIRPLLRSRALVSLGHDEYWSYEMRANVEAAIDHGLSVAFLGANACYWQVRFEPTQFGANRMMVCYKDAWLFTEDSEVQAGDPRRTTTWRDDSLGRPEQNLCGLMFYNYAEKNQQAFVAKSTHTWPYTGSGVSEGSAFAGVMGYEVDRIMANGETYAEALGKTYTIDALEPGRTPLLLGRSPYSGDLGNSIPADTALTTTRTGAKIFGAGTVGWGAALMEPSASYKADDVVNGLGHGQLQTLTRNILDNFKAGPLGLIGFDDDGGPANLWTTQWGRAPMLQAWPSGERHVAVGRFTALADGRDEVALLRAAGTVGPRLGIFGLDARDELSANAWMSFGASTLLNGWHDPDDRVLAGDFRGLGHDQLLFINTDSTPPNIGRLAIVDFSGPAANRLFYEAYGTSS
ncbi:N,N-dimethylformamidase beta subunit family domain-containing protein, partial [Solirubrobacter soli]|uniref:N,N-dimethylformamidase beta subunit family domain-containing protein n=1 Tax=Solirubrobacter soli TaxID=363832 RepID=UPI0027D33DBA